MMDFMIFVVLASSHLLLTLAVSDQFSHPVAGFHEELIAPSFLWRRSAVATGGIAAIITLSLILIFNKRKQATLPVDGSSCPSPEVLRCFSFNEIVSATKNFSRPSFIGRLGFGHVYEGFIDDGKQRVAIIRLSFHLWNKVKALSKLRHDNLVSLIGYCNVSSGTFLVYESMTPLSKSLSINLQTNITSLSWPQRLKICIGAARGLDYLHTCTDGGITHGDLKSSDILLDENYKPKIAYFGLTKLEEPSHIPQKSDVYSFGIVLLEVLRGKTSRNSVDQLIMIGQAKSLTGDGSIDWMVDPCLNGQISPNCLKEFVGVLRKCLRDDPEMRPTMVQVVARLALLPHNNNVRGTTRAAATEPMCNVARQNVLWTEFVDATGDFNEIQIWYGPYGRPACKIYTGIHRFGSRKTPYIIYRGNNVHDDISKLTELSNLSHPNLATLKGYCCKCNEIFVGYKNEGSLLVDYYWSWVGIMYLSWSSRLKICIGVAEAIKCMHASNIIHGGICPLTVLVDSSYCAKLATFATVSSLWNTAYNGLPLPLPPDIAGSAQMTEKTDVYLFGLLLLIVFCGTKMGFSGGYPFLLQNKLKVAMDQRTLWNVTDMNLSEIEYSLNEFLEVAFDCCRLEPSDRPSMDTVVECLKEAQALQYG